MKNTRPSFAADSVSILFLSLMRREHTNLFRFSADLTEPIDPEIEEKRYLDDNPRPKPELPKNASPTKDEHGRLVPEIYSHASQNSKKEAASSSEPNATLNTRKKQ